MLILEISFYFKVSQRMITIKRLVPLWLFHTQVWPLLCLFWLHHCLLRYLLINSHLFSSLILLSVLPSSFIVSDVKGSGQYSVLNFPHIDLYWWLISQYVILLDDILKIIQKFWYKIRSIFLHSMLFML